MLIPIRFPTSLLSLLFLSLTAQADSPPPLSIPLPGSPFGVTASSDANWVFVALTGPDSGVAVLHRNADSYKLDHVVPIAGGPTGIVLTHDGKNVIVAAGQGVVVLDVGKMTSGTADPTVADFSDGGDGTIYVNVTKDDKTLFVSDEESATVTVVDLDRVRTKGFDAQAIVGKIPVGEAPIALTFSPDDHLLYTTSEGAAPDWGWADSGAVLVIDVAKAKTDPPHSVLAKVRAGSSPVRMTISPDGKFIFVTARGENNVLMFDTAKLISDPDHARLATVPVGPAPVPDALIQDGKTLVVGNSNRFANDSDKPQTLSVIDVSKMPQGNAVIGTIPSGAFPREMCVTADGRTLFVSNFNSQTLEVIDARNPPIQPN